MSAIKAESLATFGILSDEGVALASMFMADILNTFCKILLSVAAFFYWSKSDYKHIL